MPATSRIRPRVAARCVAGTALLLALVLTGCAQAPATTITATPFATLAPSGAGGVSQMGPILGTVQVWLGEFGILLWRPQLDAAGAYRFEVTNEGRQVHDFTVVRWPGNIDTLPSRSGRALLQEVEVIARSTLLDPGEGVAMDVDLGAPGFYVVLSGHGTDYGDGMVSGIRVGQGDALAVPQATPEPRDESTVAVYLLDDAMFISRDEVDGGVVTLLAQNIGPDPHDLTVVRWRGDQDALPVDEDGELLMDSLIVVGQIPTIAPGGTAELVLEIGDEFAYVLLSSLPGDYAAGLSAQISAR
jgi:uncharacterized cupredoxin-like copper-binding protein